MGRDTEADYKRRRDTPGTFDHFAYHANHALQKAQDKRNLPEPLTVMLWATQVPRSREPWAEYLTPEVARSLGKVAEEGQLRDGMLVLNAFMPAGEFERSRSLALKAAGVRRPSKKPSAIECNRWLHMLFLYLTELEQATPSDLAKRFLFDGGPHEFGRDRRKANRLTQQVRDGIDTARGFLREHGVQT